MITDRTNFTIVIQYKVPHVLLIGIFILNLTYKGEDHAHLTLKFSQLFFLNLYWSICNRMVHDVTLVNKITSAHSEEPLTCDQCYQILQIYKF